MTTGYSTPEPVCIFREERGIVTAETWEAPETTWMDFSIGERAPAYLMLGVTLRGYAPLGGAEFIVDGCDISNCWSLDQLRQLHADLGALLSDERLVDTLANARPLDA